MANRPIRPGNGQEALFSQDEVAVPAVHLFDQLSQYAEGVARMDEARDIASGRDQTPLGIVLDVSAELRRRELAYAADRYKEDLEEQIRLSDMGQGSVRRVVDEEAVDVHEAHHPKPKRVRYHESPGPVRDDPTPIDGLARQEPVYPLPVDRSIASRHLPRIQWETHENAMDLRDQTPVVGTINEGDPVPVFPQPKEFESKIHVRDDHARWYESR